MAIDPTKASGSQPLAGNRLDQAGGNQAARQSGQVRTVAASEADRAAADDRVQLSAEARASRPTEGTSASGLSAERLQEILKRVTSGYYDSPQVVDKVASRVAGELGGPTATAQG